MRQWLRATFTLDERSLAVSRIAFAALVLVDLAWRASDLEAHYADSGVLPRAAFSIQHWGFLWSLHTLSGSAWFEGALLALQAACAVAIGLGRWTRVATVGVWLLLASLHARNPLLRDGQDDLMRILAFWFLFLPMGTRFSLDGRRGRVVPAGAACFTLQVCAVYWSSAVAKLASPWWQEGKGVLFSLSLGRYETWLGQRLLNAPGLLQAANFAVIAIEALLPFLLLVPVRWVRLRLAVIGAFVLMHLSFALCMRLGAFPYLSIAMWLAFVPGAVWDRLGVRASPEESVVAAPRAVDAFAVVCLALVGLYNAYHLEGTGRLPRWFDTAGAALGLQQWWAVFAPGPGQSVTDGWLVIPATLDGGEQVDLQASDKRLTWERPERVSATYPNVRWRHYVANLIVAWPYGSPLRQTLDESRQSYARLLCRRWNAEHGAGQKLVRLSMFFMSHPVGPARRPVRRVHLVDHACGE